VRKLEAPTALSSVMHDCNPTNQASTPGLVSQPTKRDQASFIISNEERVYQPHKQHQHEVVYISLTSKANAMYTSFITVAMQESVSFEFSIEELRSHMKSDSRLEHNMGHILYAIVIDISPSTLLILRLFPCGTEASLSQSGL
jgi:hypothetical protein